MQHFTLPRDGQLDLQFEGMVIAHVSSRVSNQEPWEELTAYKTVAGSLIIQRQKFCYEPHLKRSSSVLVVSNVEQAFKFSGAGSLARELFSQAEIPINQIVG